ncbi:MAG: hypothetical protein KF855_01610 [Acidobacteria bacterium]|nr:hypothetical protein [Acidobacteriota bacterium]
MITVEGIYKNGRIELLESVSVDRQSKVLVTFLENSDVSLSAHGIDEEEAAELRNNLAAFEDWDDPAMDVYNDYDNARNALNGGA